MTVMLRHGRLAGSVGPVRAIDISVYMVSCNMIGRGKTKTKKFGREELGRPRPRARKCERRPYCNAAISRTKIQANVTKSNIYFWICSSGIIYVLLFDID